MPFIAIIVGIAFLVAAVRGSLIGVASPTGSQAAQGQGLLDLLGADFVGANNFFAWIVAIGLVGSVGYIRPIKPISDGFLVLIIVVLFLAANSGKNGGGAGFFAALESALVKGTQTPPASATGSPIPGFQADPGTGALNPITLTVPGDPAPNFGNFTAGGGATLQSLFGSQIPAI